MYPATFDRARSEIRAQNSESPNIIPKEGTFPKNGSVYITMKGYDHLILGLQSFSCDFLAIFCKSSALSIRPEM